MCRPVNPILHQIRVKMQLACFFNVLEWWLLIERNQSQWPDFRVLLAFAFHLARQTLYGNSIAPSSSGSCPFVVSSFFGYLLLVIIVPHLFPFRHVARRNVARAIAWNDKKRTRNASLRARNSGLRHCWARDFFFFKITSLFVNFHKTKKIVEPKKKNKNYTINQNKK